MGLIHRKAMLFSANFAENWPMSARTGRNIYPFWNAKNRRPAKAFASAGPPYRAAEPGSPRRHIHHLAAIQHLVRLGAVEIALPGGDHDGGDAVADQVAERAGHADE